MRKLGWLASVALAVVVGATAAPASGQTSPESLGVTSFSGAYLAGRAAEADNDLDAAIEYYKRALVSEPENQPVQQSIMLALIADGRFEEALPFAERLKAVPDVERFSRVALAVDAFRKKDYAEAEYMLKLSLSSDLDKLIAGVMTAWAKAGAGDAKGGMEYLGTLEGPQWYGLFLNIHRALIADYAGLKDEAEKAYDETVVARSAADVAPEAYVRLIEAYSGFLARKGDKAKALDVLRRVDEFSPSRPSTAALRKDIVGGRPIPLLAPTPQEGAAELLLDVGSALNRGGGEAFVRLYLQFARALSPKNDAVLIQLGAVAEQQQKLEESIKFYGEVSPKSPMKRISELQLGLNLAELKRTDEAISHLAKLIETDPSDMRAYLALGGTYAGEEKFREAAGVYDRAVAQLKNPVRSDWSVFYQRGIAYERLREWPKAEPNFKKALELFPNQPQVLNYLGYSWIDMNINLEEGLEMIKKAVDLRPSDGFIIDSLGWGYYRLGRYEEAVTELERAVALQPADPVLNDHLGDAYWRVGRKLEATFQWSHARDLKPEPDILAKVTEKLAKGLPDEPPRAMAALDTKPDTNTATDASPADGPKVEVAPEPQPTQQAAAPAAPAQPGQSYTVGPGQSLWSIAVDKLGDGQRFGEILDLNPALGRNPNLIYPGQELKLP
nr:tetratricopeptide repeat protein [Mesorhizobium sp. J428]